jgi:hypothetical protein
VIAPTAPGTIVAPGDKTGEAPGAPAAPDAGIAPKAPGAVIAPTGPDAVIAPVAPGTPGGALAPGGVASPGDKAGGDKALAPAEKGSTAPLDTNAVKPGDINSSGVGGAQTTNVLLAPPGTVTPVSPDKALLVPNKLAPVPDNAAGVPGKTDPGQTVPGPPVEVPVDGKILDASGRPVEATPGKEITLPSGGAVVDAHGKTIPIPPGGKVIVPSRALTPGDFLPKMGNKSEQVPQDKKTEKQPGKDEQKTSPAKPGAPLQPSKSETGKTQKEQRTKSKPEPEQPQKEQASAKPKSGDPLQIPEEDCKKHTLGFLKGCWRGVVNMTDKTDVTIRFCFNENGVGKRVDKYKRDGMECVGPTSAKWTGDELSFSFNVLYCSDGHRGIDVPIVCRGCGANTKCLGTEYNNRTNKVTGKTNFPITRE